MQNPSYIRYNFENYCDIISFLNDNKKIDKNELLNVLLQNTSNIRNNCIDYIPELNAIYYKTTICPSTKQMDLIYLHIWKKLNNYSTNSGSTLAKTILGKHFHKYGVSVFSEIKIILNALNETFDNLSKDRFGMTIEDILNMNILNQGPQLVKFIINNYDTLYNYYDSGNIFYKSADFNEILSTDLKLIEDIIHKLIGYSNIHINEFLDWISEYYKITNKQTKVNIYKLFIEKNDLFNKHERSSGSLINNLMKLLIHTKNNVYVSQDFKISTYKYILDILELNIINIDDDELLKIIKVHINQNIVATDVIMFLRKYFEVDDNEDYIKIRKTELLLIQNQIKLLQNKIEELLLK